ncbi:MAG: NADH-quinone oxidoreductase subunit L [Phycisphaeraceae bacterium]|nr:NADH-quinone oxidoreductase subunit L [Phycisphaeraceae bacterium]
MDETILTLLVLAMLMPLAGTVLLLCAGRMIGDRAGWVATSLLGFSFLCCVTIWGMWPDRGHRVLALYNWLPITADGAGFLEVGLFLDSLGVAMMAMVSGIAALVHLYSIGYMRGDPRYTRFFAYLSLFTFSMMGIVISPSLIQLLVFWELVGLTSYLLIGFWYEKRAPQLACRKAFIMNRVGDAGFLIGLGILFAQLGGHLLLPATEGMLMADGNHIKSMIGALAATEAAGQVASSHAGLNDWLGLGSTGWLSLAGLGLFCGAVGKSAQFPLHTWLPDAMEGPTPVSSIVHSATMVAAGVFLTARIYPILTPEARLVIASIGLITLVMAALMALVMTDIKRVLAYSTLSQLGYMVVALGVGAWGYALFHLITHAFFKCCLFQCAGSVIHAAHHEQDMRRYGGLGRKMPWTAAAFGICVLAISGAAIPLTTLGLSGFYSKDGIIAGAFNFGFGISGQWAPGWLFWFLPLLVAYLTPLYMARAFALTFMGRPRVESVHQHAHEAPPSMLIPQLALAVMAIISGWMLWKPMIEASQPVMQVMGIQSFAWLHEPGNPGMKAAHAWLLQGAGWIIPLAFGLWWYRDGLGRASRVAESWAVRPIHRALLNKLYFDVVYDRLISGMVVAQSRILDWIDRRIVDGLVNRTAHLGSDLATATGRFDRDVIDRSLDGAAESVLQAGGVLRTTQAGRVRIYVLGIFVAILLVLIVVLASFLPIWRASAPSAAATGRPVIWTFESDFVSGHRHASGSLGDSIPFSAKEESINP